MNSDVNISWFPKWVNEASLENFSFVSPLELQRSHTNKREHSPLWFGKKPRIDSWPDLKVGLQEAQQKLSALGIEQIVDTIDRLAHYWCDKKSAIRRKARERVCASTGFSAAVVDHCFDVELRNYFADSLWRLLRREFRDPLLLDTFGFDNELRGKTMAIGPTISLVLFTGNVPALPALSIIRCLLVKSSLVAKVASGEPTFTALFLESLHELSPIMADAIIVTYWERDDSETRQRAIDIADAVIAYGGQEACEAFRKQVSMDKIYVEHGHKFSAGIVSESYFSNCEQQHLASNIKEDVFTFNQHACIAPQLYFIAAPFNAVREFAEVLVSEFDAGNEEFPIGDLLLEDAAELQLNRADHLRQKTLSPESFAFFHSVDIGWSIIVQSSMPVNTGTGNRVIYLICVTSVAEALEMLKPYQGFLQNIALAQDSENIEANIRELAALGICRICEPGKMTIPSSIWRHDSYMTLAKMVRWCDVEMHSWAYSMSDL